MCRDLPVLHLMLTKIDSASSLPTLKSFKDISFPFFHYGDTNAVEENVKKQGMIGLMTARESGKG